MKTKVKIFKTKEELAYFLGERVDKMVHENPGLIMGLATGSSQVSNYNAIASIAKKNNTCYARVTGFNLDEYVGLMHDDVQSYKYYMDNNFFHRLNIDLRSTYFPYSFCEHENYTQQICKEFDSGKNMDYHNFSGYDRMIESRGGLDFQLLGLGVNGHIAFNEPGTPWDSETHLVKLHNETIDRNAHLYFDGKGDNVPHYAVSMGIKSIMNAKEIFMTVTGKIKNEILKEIFSYKDKKPTLKVPATILFQHPNCWWLLDEEAAEDLEL